MRAGELGADVPITIPKRLMAINSFFLRTSPVGAQCCCPLLHYFTNMQQGEEVSPAGSICSSSVPPCPLQCWSAGERLVWCPTTPGKRTGTRGGLRTRPDGHSSHLTVWSIQKTVWDSRTAILRVEPPCTREICGITKWMTWVSQLSAWTVIMFNLTSFFLSLFWSVDGVFWSSTIVELLYDICLRQWWNM